MSANVITVLISAQSPWPVSLLAKPCPGHANLPALADVLKAAGYRTIALGKRHLGYAPRFHPLSRGLGDSYGFLPGDRSYFPLSKPAQSNGLLRDRPAQMPEKFDYLTDEPGRAAA